MATTEFIEHLDAAIASLDVEIAKLTLVRDNVAEIRAGFAQPPSDEFVAFETLAKTVVAHPKGGAANMVARKPTTGQSRYDYVEVARVANAAVRVGVSPTQAVRRHFNVTDAMGTYLLRFMERAEWMDDANCLGSDTHMFFPHPTELDVAAKAKRICRACDVQAECLAYALNNTEDGIWGGTSERERRRIRRQAALNLRLSRASVTA